MTSEGEQVTDQQVDRLWLDAIEGHKTTLLVSQEAEQLLDLVSSESPVTNWGLTTLHAMTGVRSACPEKLSAARFAWLSEVERYRADPAAWIREYFLGMLRSHRESFGLEKARTFARKLVDGGQISEFDLPEDLRPRPR